jgi:hypothetical protein
MPIALWVRQKEVKFENNKNKDRYARLTHGHQKKLEL